MNRPVIIVDPLSSGIELAPAFMARGVPAIAITLKTDEWPEFGAKIKGEDFIKIIPDQPHIEKIIKRYNPIAIIPGTEEGTPLGSSFENLKHHFRHGSRNMAKKNNLTESSFILKPPMSSGSEMVFHIPAGGEWKKPFQRILNEPSVTSGKKNESVIIQEEAIGTEYAVGTVSANGKHYLAHLIKYNKTSAGERKTVFDHVEFVPYEEQSLGHLWEYAKKCLDALGVHWGPAHTVIIITKNGPRLIESSSRMIGGPVVNFARAATGSSQADKLIEIYLDGEVRTKEYAFKKTVVPVFLRAYTEGVVSNVEIFHEANHLQTQIYHHSAV